MTLDAIAQVCITIFGIGALILVAKKNKWGFVLGLLSQPFWLFTSFVNEQWGIFALAVVYTFTWALGIYEWFFKKQPEEIATPLETEKADS